MKYLEPHSDDNFLRLDWHCPGGIRVEVVGDSGPFSIVGKSIGYRLSVGDSHYLIDCGAPIFQLLGVEGVNDLKAVVGTHSHEDHKRWFTDLCLFKLYTPQITRKLTLITSETIHEEYKKSSRAALERSLSFDSKKVVNVPYETFVDPVRIGPRAKFRIKEIDLPGQGAKAYRVVDKDGEIVPPQKAKVIINPDANIPRMLFRDDDYGEWIEPDTFYPYSSSVFYEDRKDFVDPDERFSIRAVKSSAWHGPPTIALRIETTTGERLMFSSDTFYDPKLWEILATETRDMNLGGMSFAEFEKVPLIYGDINDFKQREWSRERLREALRAYDDAVLIHDVNVKGAVVHTDYEKIVKSGAKKLVLTHSPDEFTSEWPLAKAGKVFRIVGEDLLEETEKGLFTMSADVYVKRGDRLFVGFKSPKGEHRVFEEDGILSIVGPGEEGAGRERMRVRLYEDVRGGYYPVLKKDTESYIISPGGRVNYVKFEGDLVKGKKARDLRGKLSGGPFFADGRKAASRRSEKAGG